LAIIWARCRVMRVAKLLLVLAAIAAAGPAFAEEPAAAPPVVILRGSSAPPTPWYEPPPEPEVTVPEDDGAYWMGIQRDRNSARSSRGTAAAPSGHGIRK
jgi:hypothetical protein